MSKTILPDGLKCREVLIADNSPIIRYGIKCLLGYYFPQAEIRDAASGREVMAHYLENTGDILIVDPNLSDSDPQTLIQTLLVRRPGLLILVFSIYKEELFSPLYMKMGVKGFLNKRCPEMEIVTAVRAIEEGGQYIRADMQELYARCNRDSSPYEQLTPREWEVLRCLAQGESVTSISKRTHNSTNTVSTHKANIFKKLSLSNLIELKSLVDNHPIEC